MMGSWKKLRLVGTAALLLLIPVAAPLAPLAALAVAAVMAAVLVVAENVLDAETRGTIREQDPTGGH